MRCPKINFAEFLALPFFLNQNLQFLTNFEKSFKNNKIVLINEITDQ